MIWMYGGTFNPPTLAHKKIINTVQKHYPMDKVFIVPVGDHYNKKDIIDFHHRKHMLERMLPGETIIDLEQHIAFQGTIATLDWIHKTYQEPVGFIIGSDQLESLMTWIQAETLLKTYPCIIITRPTYDITAYQHVIDAYPNQFKIIYLSEHIASSEIRKNIHKHKALLDAEVYQYIKTHQLYEE